MLAKKTFATHEVVAWGTENFYIRSDRSKRDFLSTGLITKLSNWQKEVRGWTCKDSVYEANERAIKEYLKEAEKKRIGQKVLFEV